MGFSEELIQKVWEKGRGLANQDSTEWRQDTCGAWMEYSQYGNAESEFGWKIEHISGGGGDQLDNLQPFHWQNTYNIASSVPHCKVTADRTGLSPGQSIDHPHNKSS
jgi:hypothetical protein